MVKKVLMAIRGDLLKCGAAAMGRGWVLAGGSGDCVAEKPNV